MVISLVGAICIPSVSAGDVEESEKCYVSPADSDSIANQTFGDFIASGGLDHEIFAGSELSKDPIYIYDPNGLVLFHQYDLTKDGKNLDLSKPPTDK